jgi:hypothetical protein
MSCWVVPTLAAELWQIPLDQLMGRIRDGEIPVKDEDGFTFVDVAPYGPHIQRPNVPPHERPATFTAATFTAAEDEPVSDLELAILTEQTEPPVLEDESGPVDNTGSLDLGDWRSARRKAGRTRVAPVRLLSA